ncbi:hypothetical protein ACFSTC_60840 [Nonomuraea ferruginea]
MVHHEQLTDPALWGRPISDERYVLIAHPSQGGAEPMTTGHPSQAGTAPVSASDPAGRS